MELLKECSNSKRAETLFNNEAVDDEGNDKRRRQIFFHAIEDRHRQLFDLRSTIQYKVDSMFKKRRSQDWVVLRSNASRVCHGLHGRNVL